MQPGAALRRADQKVHEGARRGQPWIEPVGRLGYGANGAVYGMVGLLAGQAAIGLGGETTDPKGVLPRLLEAPLGQLVLFTTAVGLAGYALWRLLQAVLDTEQAGRGLKGWVTRVGYGVAGLAYAGLAVSAARLLQGDGGGDSGEAATQDWTARLLDQPAGPWLVGLVGIMVLGAALAQGRNAATASFRRCLRQETMTRQELRWTVALGRVGYAARGVVFGLIGVFLLSAARSSEPSDAHGLGGALSELAAKPAGPWLLGAVALGLLAYAAFELAQARYRRMRVA